MDVKTNQQAYETAYTTAQRALQSAEEAAKQAVKAREEAAAALSHYVKIGGGFDGTDLHNLYNAAHAHVEACHLHVATLQKIKATALENALNPEEATNRAYGTV